MKKLILGATPSVNDRVLTSLLILYTYEDETSQDVVESIGL